MNVNAAKLSAEQVQTIRDLRRADYTFTSIAAAFNLSHRSVRNLIQGRTWTHVADVPQPLPVLAPDVSAKLKPRRANAKLLFNNSGQAEYATPAEPTTEPAGIGSVPANAIANDRIPTGSEPARTQNLSKAAMTAAVPEGEAICSQ